MQIGTNKVRKRHTTMARYRALPETTRPTELVHNVLHEPPAPLYGHQHLLVTLVTRLNMFVEDNKLGTLLSAPFDVYLDDVSNAVQPDLLIILNDNPGKLDGQFYGSPDFIIEILSPWNRRHDRKTKKTLYEKFGVKEYWIIDPNSKAVTGYSLENGRYVNLPTVEGKIHSPLLKFSVSF